jgi:dTDP-4-dehydrorhamnose reductase
MKRILVTGSGGQLGSELCRQLGQRAIPIDVDRLDITSEEQVHRIIEQLRPDCVINTAAYTAVDKAETDSQRCLAVNRDGVRYLADATRDAGARLVQISTDYVFGRQPVEARPWKEEDQPHPAGVYAQSKLAGEVEAASNPNHLIVRSCGLYGRPGPTATGNFVATMLRLGRERPSVRVVNDQRCTPTWVPELAATICFLTGHDLTGIVHVTNRGETTWFEFAGEIFRVAGIPCQVEPISSAEYGSPVPRPPYSVLDTSKYDASGGPKMSNWRDALRSYLLSDRNER